MIYDYCVVGGGIVGMAAAMSLLERSPGASIIVLEKEAVLARHQTGHNSGVIHSGIYYEPGSLKADYCRRGAAATKEFCARHGIPVNEIGKLLVATNAPETARLLDLENRAALNGIAVQRLSGAELHELEPNVAGVGALLVHSTATVDYRKVVAAMEQVVSDGGGRIELGVEVRGIRESASKVTVTGTRRAPGVRAKAAPDSARVEWTARQLVVCGGLQADRLARMAGIRTGVRIVPFRGEYYELPESRRGVVNRLIYPVPDPSLPFLGVHLTPMVDGRVTVGPNAVLGLSREGYRKGSLNLADLRDILGFPGFWRVARSNLMTGAVEMRNSLFKRGFLSAARKYCPGLRPEDLLPCEAGIRAQAVQPDGTLLHDFLFLSTDRTLHVINAPSPAATSAIPIGQEIASRCRGVQIQP
jgi:L-2-hydroxyglutarate oxidase